MKNLKRILPMFLLCFVLILAICVPLVHMSSNTFYAETGEVIEITALDGTASDNSNEGYSNLFDGKNSGTNFTKWCVNASSAYVVFKTSIPVVVSGYSFITGNDNQTYPGRNPHTWKLYGSTEYNETSKTGTWTEIHSVNGDSTMGDVNFTKYDFSIDSNTNFYQYYKLEITSNKNGSALQMCGLEIDCSTCAHDWVQTGVKEASCLQPAYTLYKCNECGLQSKSKNGEALGHYFYNNTCVHCNTKITAQTVGPFVVTGGVKDVDYKYENNTLTILTSKHLIIANADPDTEITTDKIYINKDISANVTLAGVKINRGWENYDNTNSSGECAFEIAQNSTGNVVITLAEGSSNFLMSGKNCAGLQKNGAYGSLTINGTGRLEVYGGQGGAGIGSGRTTLTNIAVSNITIKDCTIIAGGSRLTSDQTYAYISYGSNGGSSFSPAPGIGSGYPSDSFASGVNIAGNIKIINATVSADGFASPGIGAAYNGVLSNIIISGGTVEVTHPNYSISGVGLFGGKLSAGIIPKNLDGANVYLLKIANSDREKVLLDGEYFLPLVQNAGTRYLYFYVTGETHTVQVGTNVYTYTFDSETQTFSLSNTTTGSAIPTIRVVAIEEGETAIEGTDYSYISGVLTILSNKKMMLETDGSEITDRIVIQKDINADITLKNVNINVSAMDNTPALSIENDSIGNVKITLASGSKNILKSGKYCAGLQKNGDTETIGTLTINGEGSLMVFGGENAAGLGSGYNINEEVETSRPIRAKNITISGGKIIAIGGAYGAGIGTGNGAQISYVKISGGKISALGGVGAAGIGAGDFGLAVNFEITGGVITAIGGQGAAGIGGGKGNPGAIFTISGGVILAIAGEADSETGIAGAGIGDAGGLGGMIQISGGSVLAKTDGQYAIGSVEGKQEIIPTNSMDENVYLLEIENPNYLEVKIDGTSYLPLNHGALDDTNLYVYLTGEEHTITVGNNTMKYHFVDSQFVLCSASTTFNHDETGHWYACSTEGCEVKHNFSAHNFNQEVVSDAYLKTSATCTTKPVYYKSCICGRCGTEAEFRSGSSLGHDFDTINWTNDGTQHWHACKREGCEETYSGKLMHSYFNPDCSSTCGVCGYIRPESEIPHNPLWFWAYDTNQHWHGCNGIIDNDRTPCPAKFDTANHTYANGLYTTIDDVHYPKCDTCNYYDSTRGEDCSLSIEYGDYAHWTVCSVCGNYGTGVEHIFDNSCDTTCNTEGCGYVRTVQHSYGRWQCDDNKHWKVCSNCKGKGCEEVHKIEECYNSNYHWTKCSTCSYITDFETDAVVHFYDNDDDRTCNGCSYVRPIKITSLSFTFSGYEVNKPILELMVNSATTNQGIDWGDEYGSFWQVLTAYKEDDFEYVYEDDPGYFMPGKEYWLCLYIEVESNAYTTSSLTINNVTVEGLGKALYKEGYSGYAEFVFRLPTLGGISTINEIPSLDFTLTGYELDALVQDLTLTPGEDNINGVQSYMEIYVQDGEYFMQIYNADAKFLVNTPYLLEIYIYAPEGYTFYGFTRDDISIAGLANINYLEISEGGGYLIITTILPSLDPDHQHTYAESWATNPEEHAKICSTCYNYVNAPHEFDDEKDIDCNICGYTRKVSIKSEFVLTNYENGKLASGIVLSPSANSYGLNWADAKYNQVGKSSWILLNTGISNFSASRITDINSYIVAGTSYYLYVTAYALSSNYYFASTNIEDYTIAGIGHSSCVILNEEGNIAMIFFELPAPKGESTVQKISGAGFTLNGYTQGQAFSGLNLIADETNVGVKTFTFDLLENGLSVSGNTGSFDATKNYTLKLTLTADSNFTTYGMLKTDVSLLGAYECVLISVNASGTKVEISFTLPSLVAEHEHSYGTDYAKDEEYHWHQCEVCGVKKDKALHTYTDENDATCNNCGYTRLIEITSATISISGYVYGANSDDIVISVKEGNISGGVAGEEYFIAKSNCLFDVFNGTIPSFGIDGGVKYYLWFALSPVSGYKIGNISKEDIFLENIGCASNYMVLEGMFSVAVFDLPVLETPHIHGGAWSDIVASTCSTEGTKAHYNCTICHKNFDDEWGEIKNLSIATDENVHKFGTWQEVDPATCISTGTKAHKDCLYCHKHFDDNGKEIGDLTIEIDSSNHHFGEWISEVPPTTESEGIKAHKDCLNCHKHFDADNEEITNLKIEKIIKEDVPSAEQNADENEGLSGGAIAGIVIGGLFVLSISCFAIIWFVFKKKRFSDLMQIFRKNNKS